MKYYKGNALDLVESLSLSQHIPIMYCYIKLDTFIDIERLKDAINWTTLIIPQILCSYDYSRNGWNFTKHDVNDVIYEINNKENTKNIIWNIEVGPQLRINICHQSDGDSLQIGMSHILADGMGFLQYIGLLCGFYNHYESAFQVRKNYRSMIPLLFSAGIHSIWHRNTSLAQKKYSSTILPNDLSPKFPVVVNINITAHEMEAIREKAHTIGVTINEVLMAAYVNILKEKDLADEITMPCPVDLRKYNKQKDKLTIANMSGKYLCQIPLEKKHGVYETALVIHQNMEQYKSKYDCFKSIPLLHILHCIYPTEMVRSLIQRGYSIESISYTNIGVIDQHKIFFKDALIKECFISGIFRKAPSFQVSVSTYRNVCTLSATMICSKNQRDIGMNFLKELKEALTD